MWTNSEKIPILFHLLPIAFGCKRALQEIITFKEQQTTYLEAIKCHFEARKLKFKPIPTRIQSNLIFCPFPNLSQNTTEL